MSSSVETPQEQINYANLLIKGNKIGLGLMVVTFFIYVFGILEPHVPMEQLTVLWQGNAHHYLTDGNVPTGWGWVGLLGNGDFINFLGIAILAGLTIVAYIPLVPAYLKQGDKAYAAICVAEILVLLVAASGLVGTGGH